MQKGRFLCTKKPFSSGLKKLVAGGTHLRDNLADGSDNCFRLFVRDAETGIRNNYLSASRGEVRQLRLQLMDPGSLGQAVRLGHQVAAGAVLRRQLTSPLPFRTQRVLAEVSTISGRSSRFPAARTWATLSSSVHPAAAAKAVG